jgi:hypothetical protein
MDFSDPGREREEPAGTILRLRERQVRHRGQSLKFETARNLKPTIQNSRTDPQETWPLLERLGASWLACPIQCPSPARTSKQARSWMPSSGSGSREPACWKSRAEASRQRRRRRLLLRDSKKCWQVGISRPRPRACWRKERPLQWSPRMRVMPSSSQRPSESAGQWRRCGEASRSGKRGLNNSLETVGMQWDVLATKIF